VSSTEIRVSPGQDRAESGKTREIAPRSSPEHYRGEDTAIHVAPANIPTMRIRRIAASEGIALLDQYIRSAK